MTIAMTTSIVTLKTKATEMQNAMTLTAEGEDDEELHDKRDKGGYDDGDHNDQRDDGSVVVHRKRLQKKLSMRILHQKTKPHRSTLKHRGRLPSASSCQTSARVPPRGVFAPVAWLPLASWRLHERPASAILMAETCLFLWAHPRKCSC